MQKLKQPQKFGEFESYALSEYFNIQAFFSNRSH